MVPFLTCKLARVMLELCQRFVKKEFVASDITQSDLFKLKVTDEKLHVTRSSISVGFSADKKLKTLLANKKISKKHLIGF